MRKYALGIVVSMMAVSMAACTPTTQKQATTAAAEQMTVDPAAMPTTGGASDKVPDPNVAPESIITIYHLSDASYGVDQSMDSIPGETLDAQLIIDKLVEYGVLSSGTQVLSFTIDENTGDAVLDLNQAVKMEDCADDTFLTELGNTFIVNYELSSLKLRVNGENFAGEEIQQSDDDVQTYRKDLDDLE